MSVLLHLYPGYQTIQCMKDPEHPGIEHWLTFWISSYTLDQVPLPGWISWPAIALLYLPDTTTFIREKILYQGTEIVSQYVPAIKERAFRLIEKYRPQGQDQDSSWWKFW